MTHLNIIKWNKLTYIQSLRSDTVTMHRITDQENRELDNVLNEFNAAWPTRMNTTDNELHCKHCNTIFWASETKSGRCPFCWRLI